MKPVIAIIAQGEMGAGVGWRLVQSGLRVVTSLAGRSDASAKRAREAGVIAVDEDEIAKSDFLLSILPPDEALSLAERLAPYLARSTQKPVYVDCNAVNRETVRRIEGVVIKTGCLFVDSGIIGTRPREGYPGPVFYASGDAAQRFVELKAYGLDIRSIAGGVGAASAVKMSYAGMTKGTAALLSAMMMAAHRAGVADELVKQLEESQPELMKRMRYHVGSMFPKAYRWIGEMEEIAGFVSDDPAAKSIYEGAARFYENLAEDVAGPNKTTAVLRDAVGEKK